MPISFSEDIRSVTDLKRHTRETLDHVHETGRPVVLTVNGRSDSVLIDAKVYEKQLKATNLSRLLSEAEAQINAGRFSGRSNSLAEASFAVTILKTPFCNPKGGFKA